MRRARRFLSVFAIVSLALSAAPIAHAANNDEEAGALVEGVFASDFVEGKFPDALEKLQLAATVCQEEGACSPEVRARVYVGIGTVFAAGLNKPDDAKEAFRLALKNDPKVKLLKGFDSDEVKQAFAAAGGAGGEGEAKAASKGPARGALEIPACDEGGRPQRGWKSAGAYACYQKALAAQEDRQWLDCARFALGSAQVDERSSTRLVAGRCLESGGRWVEALAEYEKVADAGTVSSRSGSQRAEELRGKIPKLVIRPPGKTSDLQVRLDGRAVDAGELGGEIWVDPGEHTVDATGKLAGGSDPLQFEQTLSVGEFETAAIDVKLVPKEATITDSAIMKCMTAAKTKEDFAKCIGEGPGGSEVNILIGAEASVYVDDDNVGVFTPGAYGTVTHPTDGWSVGGALLVDIVTAASSDIVATASQRWTEVRYVPSANGSLKFDDTTVAVRGNASIEPDYTAMGGGVTVSADLVGKTVTPSLGYDFGYDISGRAGTSYSTFSRTLHRHGIDGSVALVLDKATVLTLGATASLEFGDSSKPYRYIPMFDPSIVEQVPAGLPADKVDEFRNPERVLEQLPTDRQRYALSARIAHRFSSSTIRAEERLYADSWGVIATTTDARYLIDVDDRFRIWPHARGHLQSGASFWELAYASVRTSQGLQVPQLRTGDRELGPLLGVSVGGGARYAFGAEKNWALTLNADGIYTRFLDHLFILERLGVFAALMAEVEFE